MTGPQLPSPEHATTLDADLRMTLDEYAALPWQYALKRSEDGWEVRVAELPDFAYYSRGWDDLSDLPAALRSHLKAYIATGKPIPVPQCIAAAESRLRSQITALQRENELACEDLRQASEQLHNGTAATVKLHDAELRITALELENERLRIIEVDYNAMCAFLRAKMPSSG